MKTLLSLSAILITLTLTAQSNTATWYLNDTSGNGIQSPTNTASGYYSTAMGRETTASGQSSTAMGIGTTASGGYSTAMGYQSVATGDYSIAVGTSTTASAIGSIAVGAGTTASAISSTAIGSGTTASGFVSTAMGYLTTASGGYSTALGNNTTASDFNSLVIGRFNLLGSIVTNSATDFSLENTAFVIGNGADADNRSDALTVLFDGTTNVAGSVTATAFIGDGSQLTNLSVSSPFSLNDTSGNGIQSPTNTASGNYSIAMGYNTTASGDYSTAMGVSIASGDVSTAMGWGTAASGIMSTSMGSSTRASGGISTAMGNRTTASGNSSTAMGRATIASGGGSTAMGYLTTAEDYLSLAIGVHNKSDETGFPNGFSYQNTAFVIGNGGYDSQGSYVGTSDTFSNAFEVLFDGTTTIAGDLNLNSDARLKANIISLGSTLAKLLQIDGKTYTMKKDENKKQKIGVLAQDIEKVFPELVSESNGIKSVNYQGLVPVLINALKEQDSKMNEQDTKLNKQQAEIDELKAIVNKLITP